MHMQMFSMYIMGLSVKNIFAIIPLRLERRTLASTRLQGLPLFQPHFKNLKNQISNLKITS